MANGRPKKFQEADLQKLKNLMRLNPTLEDTAAFFECGQRTVEETIRNHFDLTFREFRQQNMVHTRLSLIRKAVSKAEAGDNTMLIFCLKNLCGWKDRYEQEVTGSSDPQKKLVIQFSKGGQDEKHEEKASEKI